MENIEGKIDHNQCRGWQDFPVNCVKLKAMVEPQTRLPDLVWAGVESTDQSIQHFYRYMQYQYGKIQDAINFAKLNGYQGDANLAVGDSTPLVNNEWE